MDPHKVKMVGDARSPSEPAAGGAMTLKPDGVPTTCKTVPSGFGSRWRFNRVAVIAESRAPGQLKRTERFAAIRHKQAGDAVKLAFVSFERSPADRQGFPSTGRSGAIPRFASANLVGAHTQFTVALTYCVKSVNRDERLPTGRTRALGFVVLSNDFPVRAASWFCQRGSIPAVVLPSMRRSVWVLPACRRHVPARR